MTDVFRTVCDPNCHAKPRCGIDALVSDGRIQSIRPAEFPAELGVKARSCMMGMARLEYQYHPDRLLHPMRRTGKRGDGQWERISWDEAIRLFIENQQSVTRRHGARAVLHSQFTGGSGVLNRGSASRYAALTGGTVMSIYKGGFDLGICKGLEYMFGYDAMTFWTRNSHGLDDAVNSEVILIWGGNPVVTRSVDYPPLKTAQNRGTRLVCIDPLRSATSDICDEWIPLRPGTDGALALGMLHQIIEAGGIDSPFLLQHSNAPFLVRADNGALLRDRDLNADGTDACVVWCAKADATVAVASASAPALRVRGAATLADGTTVGVASVFALLSDLAAEYPPEVASRITEVPAETIRQLALDFMKAKPAAIRAGYGIDHYYYGDMAMRAITALAVVTGNIGMPGGGVSVVGGDRVAPLRARTFYMPDGKAPATVSLMEADAAVRNDDPYPVRMECISFGNPFNQGKPDRRKVISEYVEKLEYIVVIDHFMTETARHADLVLPACTIFERPDIVVDRFVHLQQPAVKPEGEAKSDFDIYRLLAERAGLGAYFDRTPEDYLDEMLRASPELGEASLERLAREKVISPWKDLTPHICFADMKFGTASGRIELYSEQLLPYGAELPFYREPIEASPQNPLFGKYPLVLLSPHSRSRIHSTFANMTSTRREAEPVARISRRDAGDRGIVDGGMIEIVNNRSHVEIRCQVDDRVRPGCVVVEEGYWVTEFAGGDLYSLIHDHYNPLGLSYATYDVLVEIKKAADRPAALRRSGARAAL